MGTFPLGQSCWVSLKKDKISIDCGKQRSEWASAVPITALLHMYPIISGPDVSFVCGMPALNVVIHQAKVHLKERCFGGCSNFAAVNLLFKENAVTHNISVS